MFIIFTVFTLLTLLFHWTIHQRTEGPLGFRNRRRRNRRNGVIILAGFSAGVMNGSSILILHFDPPLLLLLRLPPSPFILQLERSINSYLRPVLFLGLSSHEEKKMVQQCYLIFNQLSSHFISGGMVVLRCSHFSPQTLPVTPTTPSLKFPID